MDDREITKARNDMERAAKKLNSTVSEGGRRAEATYAEAYHRLATLGVERPLRAKYRRGG